MQVVVRKTSQRATLVWTMVPMALLLAAAVFANAGLRVAPDAQAVSAGVSVDAEVTSITSISPCGASIALTVVQAGFAAQTCSVTFGASNASSVPLQASGTTAPFLSGGVFANTAVGACGAMTGDAVGFKVSSGGTSTNSTSCSATAAGTNAGYVAVPTSPTTVCTTNALGQQTCPISVGIVETGNDAAAGTYSGQINLAA